MLNPRPGATAKMPLRASRMLSRMRLVSSGGLINCTISSTLSPANVAAPPTASYHDTKYWLTAEQVCQLCVGLWLSAYIP